MGNYHYNLRSDASLQSVVDFSLVGHDNPVIIYLILLNLSLHNIFNKFIMACIEDSHLEWICYCYTFNFYFQVHPLKSPSPRPSVYTQTTQIKNKQDGGHLGFFQHGGHHYYIQPTQKN